MGQSSTRLSLEIGMDNNTLQGMHLFVGFKDRPSVLLPVLLHIVPYVTSKQRELLKGTASCGSEPELVGRRAPETQCKTDSLYTATP